MLKVRALLGPVAAAQTFALSEEHQDAEDQNRRTEPRERRHAERASYRRNRAAQRDHCPMPRQDAGPSAT